MATNQQKLSTKERVPNRSGNDLSHSVNYALEVGKLYPILCDEVLPNSTISLGVNLDAMLPNFATEFQGRIELRAEAFFCPYSVVWDGWKSFECQRNQYDPFGSVPSKVPTFKFTNGSPRNLPLLDALRFHGSANANEEYNALPILCYNKIWSDYYRDKRLQKSPFLPSDQLGSTPASRLPFQYSPETLIINPTSSGGTIQDSFADQHTIGSLRTRNFDRDYFNTCMTNSSLTDMADVDVVSNKFSINQFRNKLKQVEYKEQLARLDSDYDSISEALFGISGMRDYDRAVYLGSVRNAIYNNGVFVNNGSQNVTEYVDGDETSTTYESSIKSKNPYISNGAFGTASLPSSSANASLIDNFTARERGVVMILVSVVPCPAYTTGSSRHWIHTQHPDFGLAKFESIGNQPVMPWELTDSVITRDPAGSPFGWTERYAEYKVITDYATTEYRNLFKPFLLTRGFTSNVSLSSSFIEIPTDALDDVLAMTGKEFAKTRLNAGIVYHKVHPLSDYAIPTLVDADTHTAFIDRGSKRL